MALGITRQELNQWKAAVSRGEIAFLTHYWLDNRFPNIRTVTKVGCSDLDRLSGWCWDNGLNPTYIHHRQDYPHFDLLGSKQLEILQREGLLSHIERFRL
ncbi:hypothetical protein [Paenibacillus mendelii]|uniref:Uncharacterized protein n=1 Tax=Paenibacillus mendelii TaxID=206163 RepID=A0ABV6J9M5_9BACL|nr:hypothetical protein [Paenibacillus mendelii]MCQ6561055.1 hypothetical protein [Paenibacillus mendelii]